jgi:ATP-binding cassette, subfamily B (MDR/TAP), member 1
LRQEIGFYDLRQTGFFVNNMTEDVALIQQAYGERLTQFCQNIAQALLGIILAFTTNWRMTLMVLVAAPVVTILLGGSGPFVAIFTKRTQAAGSDATTVATEIIQAMRTVRSMSGEIKEIVRYRQSLTNVNFVAIFRSFAVAVASGLAYFSIWGCAALAFFYGGHLINWGLLTVGKLFQIFGNMLFAVLGLGLAMSHVAPMLKAVEISKLLLKVINRVPAIRPTGGKTIEGGLKGEIEVKGLEFTYPSRPEQQVLFDFNLSIKAGQTAALVGPSGGGKSTIMGLLERFYEQSKGVITIDGVDIRDFDPVWLHKEIGIVTQEPTLFAATISENIIYGVDPATVTGEQIVAAAKAANCHNFIIELNDGYNTMVGERGASLSGGQKQRVAIARAMLQNPKILLLDEATSALDTESEHLVQEALERLMVGKTSIVIAHRLSTIKSSNVIFVIEKGRVVEQGTHEDLLKIENGVYAALASRQMQFGQKHEEKVEIQVEMSPNQTDVELNEVVKEDKVDLTIDTNFEQSNSPKEEDESTTPLFINQDKGDLTLE